MKQSYKFLFIILLLLTIVGAGSAQANPTVATNEDTALEVIIPTDVGFFVQPDADLIHAFNWEIGAVVTLMIDDQGTGEADYTASAVVADEGLEIPTLDFDLAGEFDILPGHIITLSDGITTKTHIVTDLEISGVDLELDLVEGFAASESGVEVWACWSDGCTGNRVEYAGVDGIWLADFTDVEQAVLDINPGNIIEAIQWDEDGNGTVAQFIIPNPLLLAPADGVELDINTPEFQWEEMAGATGYEFAITQQSSGETAIEWFEVGDQITCEGGVCSLHPDVPLPNDGYIWSVSPYLEDYGISYQQFSFTVNVMEEEPVEEPPAEEPPAEVLAPEEPVEEPPAEEPVIEEPAADEVVEECKEYPSKLYFNQAMYGAPGPGLYSINLITGKTINAGIVSFWNTSTEMKVQIESIDGWLIKEVQLFIGLDEIPTKNNNPIPGQFPYLEELDTPFYQYQKTITFEEMGFKWGLPWEDQRVQKFAVHVELVQVNDNGKIIEEEGAWAQGPYDFGGKQWAWWGTYELGHPKTGHFIDSPVGGVTVASPTFNGKTDEAGSFTFFPGEDVDLYVGNVFLGTAMAEQRISPLSFYDNADTSDARVINMARLLQSLDVDREPKSGILITNEVEVCLNQAVAGYGEVDFADDGLVDAVINETIAQCVGVVDLVSVSAEDAQANLEDTLSSTMFRKNISKTPDLESSKSKLNIMGMWFPALKANGEPAIIEYYDADGKLIRTTEEAKPIVVVYTDAIDEYGNEDIFAGISRDDGNTFKTVNLSRSADRTSFTLANGAAYYGDTKKPVFGISGNNILVAWTSKYCNGGKPTYAISEDDDYLYDDPYYQEDIWGVAGPQRSVDYTEQGFPEVGEVPYSCVWIARGTIVTEGMLAKGWDDYQIGDIVWFKPERLTSGRRDANQVFMGTAPGAGFAISWQEDPEGLRPGGADGPGPGWGGATTNHKTDIWYSYVTQADFLKIDSDFIIGGDPEHDLDILARPKALVPMALPVRVTDNDVVNSDNIMAETTDFSTWTPVSNPNTDGDGDGTHAYGYAIDGLCKEYYEKINEQGETKQVCVTADGRLLDGDTGASRPNLFLQAYTNNNGTPLDTSDDYKSAWAIFAYEETKGVGAGAPENAGEGEVGLTEFVIDEGKNAIYHSFDFQNPDLVSAGTIVNHPELDEYGNPVYLVDENGAFLLDWQGYKQLAYENARRPRFILQSKTAATTLGSTNTVLLALYKEGEEGSGRPSDIMMRRMVASAKGNPYAPENFICDAWFTVDNGSEVCIDGAMNMSSVTPTVTTDSMGDPQVDDPYGAVKVVEWVQTVDNLNDPSWLNPYDDARAHRGAIRGDFVVMGFSYTPNWAAARNGNDKYDFYIRRSFDGGVTWTTDPNPLDASAVYETCNTWTYPSGTESPGTKVEVCNTYAPGEFEQMRNVSQLPNNKESVIEPRIVAVPGTIKDPATGQWTGIPEDKQNRNVFYLSYGTSTNPKKDPITGEQEEPYPLDLYYSFSMNRGESLIEVAWDVNPESDGNYAGQTIYRWDYLAKGDPEQGEAQLRMTPDGSRFYATWLQEGEEGSDIWFRRIMSPAFTVNVAP